MPQLFGAEFHLDPTRPIYLQIIERVKEAVARGVLQPGDQIPAQRELAELLRVNPNTVQRAYREMEYLGLVETARGTGTFITLDPQRVASFREEMAAEAMDRFLRSLRDLGFTAEEIERRVAAALRERPAPRRPGPASAGRDGAKGTE